MTALEGLKALTELAFGALFLLTIVDFARWRDRIRLEIALLFGSIAPMVLILAVHAGRAHARQPTNRPGPAAAGRSPADGAALARRGPGPRPTDHARRRDGAAPHHRGLASAAARSHDKPHLQRRRCAAGRREDPLA